MLLSANALTLNCFFASRALPMAMSMPEWLFKFGLDAYEYQCGNGVRIGEETAGKIKEAAEKYKIEMSLHSPYFINLATPDEQKQINSIDYILQSARAAKAMGASRVVVSSSMRLS